MRIITENITRSKAYELVVDAEDLPNQDVIAAYLEATEPSAFVEFAWMWLLMQILGDYFEVKRYSKVIQRIRYWENLDIEMAEDNPSMDSLYRVMSDVFFELFPYGIEGVTYRDLYYKILDFKDIFSSEEYKSVESIVQSSYNRKKNASWSLDDLISILGWYSIMEVLDLEIEVDDYMEENIDELLGQYGVGISRDFPGSRGLICQDGSIILVGDGTDHRYISMELWDQENLATYHMDSGSMTLRIHNRMSRSMQKVVDMLIEDYDVRIVYLEIYVDDSIVVNDSVDVFELYHVIHDAV